MILSPNSFVRLKFIVLIWNSEAYRTIFNKVNDAILIHPFQKEGFANFIAVNEPAIQKYGYTEEEFLTLSPEDITEEEDVKVYRTKEHRQELHESGQLVFETTHYTKDGNKIPVEISSNVARIEDREVIITFVRDISERVSSNRIIDENREQFQNNELKLKRTLQILDLAQKTAQIGIWWMSLPSMQFSWTTQMFGIFGLPPTGGEPTVEEMIKFIHSEDREKFRAMIDTCPAQPDKAKVVSFRVVRINGDIRFVELTCLRLLDNDGNTQKIIGTARDITEKKISEEKLSEANENLKVTLEAIPDMMFEADIEGRVLDFHIPGHQRPYLDPEVLFGVKIQKALPENVANIILKAIEETNLKGWSQGTAFSLEMDGDVKWYELSISKKVGYRHPQKRFIILVRDISVRKNMEDNLQNQNRKYLKLNEKLSRALSALENLNSELKEAKLKAEESDRLKTAFLSNISHEIRTPMNGIIGFVDLLKSREDLDPRQTKYLSIIEKSSIRLLKIINNIVEIAKIESHNFSVKHEIIDLDMLFSELYQDNFSYAERRGIDLKFKNKITRQGSYIQSDKKALKKILENLIDNAIKYTFEGEVTYGCQIHNNYIEFYVNDTGEGIRRKDLNIIFDQFSQGNPVFSTINNGAGLGLSIAKAHVNILGGKIWVESELGEGSSFHFTIPLVPVDTNKAISERENLTTRRKEKK